jgi:hypothetical protein
MKGMSGMSEPMMAANPTIRLERIALRRFVGARPCSSVIMTPTHVSLSAVMVSTI